jgi:hypothetical protein
MNTKQGVLELATVTIQEHCLPLVWKPRWTIIGPLILASLCFRNFYFDFKICIIDCCKQVIETALTRPIGTIDNASEFHSSNTVLEPGSRYQLFWEFSWLFLSPSRKIHAFYLKLVLKHVRLFADSLLSISSLHLISYTYQHIIVKYKTKKQTNPMVWFRERTIPTERPPLLGEVIANFCG